MMTDNVFKKEFIYFCDIMLRNSNTMLYETLLRQFKNTVVTYCLKLPKRVKEGNIFLNFFHKM